ncbi:hypothetical protein HRG_014097 [Hirsutella rhossiliensis]
MSNTIKGRAQNGARESKNDPPVNPPRETWKAILRAFIKRKGHFLIPLCRVFAYKTDEQGYVTRFKARIVLQRDQQPEDDEDTYEATLRARTFRMLVAFCCLEDFETEQYDIKTALSESCTDYASFLNWIHCEGIGVARVATETGYQLLVDALYIPIFLTNGLYITKFNAQEVLWNNVTEELRDKKEVLLLTIPYFWGQHWIQYKEIRPKGSNQDSIFATTAFKDTRKPQTPIGTTEALWHARLGHPGATKMQHITSSTPKLTKLGSGLKAPNGLM